MNVGHQAELMGFCQTRMRQHRGEKHDLDIQKEVRETDNLKEEMAYLHKQVKHLKNALTLMQISLGAFLIVWGLQYLRLLRNYQDLLQSINLCLESVRTVYSALQQFLLIL